MTNAQARKSRPLFLPPLRCPNFRDLEPAILIFEAVETIVYLGSVIQHDGGTGHELAARLTSGHIAYGKLRGQLGAEKNALKVWLYEVYVSSRLFFGVETWAQTKSQCSKLNSTRMNQLRTITNCWFIGKMEDLTCAEHTSSWIYSTRPTPRPSNAHGQDKCKLCKATGTARFWYARRFLVNLNSLRNRNVLKYTFPLYRHLRRRKAKSKEVKNIMRLIAEFAEMRQPNWLPHWLPRPSNRAILERYDLPSTEILIAKRRANLLGNLLRHMALPKFCGGRAGWWNTVNNTLGVMKLHLDEAWDITFWRNAVRKTHTELQQQQKLPKFN